MYNYNIIHIVEEHLYSYYSIEHEIRKIMEKYSVNDKDINSWIKSKGKINRSTESIAIKNIEIENEIVKKIEWHYLIEKILKYYENDEPDKYLFIKLRYFDKCSTTKIEMKMAICRATQSKIKTDIVYNIAMYAVSNNLIKL